MTQVNIEVPFDWDGDALTIKKTGSTKDGRQQLIFAPTKATIAYEKVPEIGGRWSWKFNEDITQQDNGYKGNFWGEPWEYYATPWFREDGFGVGNLVEVSLRCEEKKTGNGWFTNIEEMHLVPVEEDPPKQATESPQTAPKLKIAPTAPSGVVDQQKHREQSILSQVLFKAITERLANQSEIDGQTYREGNETWNLMAQLLARGEAPLLPEHILNQIGFLMIEPEMPESDDIDMVHPDDIVEPLA